MTRVTASAAPIRRPGEVDLAALGLRSGEVVRFRRGDKGRWLPGRLERIERDGSIGIRDAKGSARALRPQHVEVEGTGPRGAKLWEPLVERMTRGEQLPLF